MDARMGVEHAVGVDLDRPYAGFELEGGHKGGRRGRRGIDVIEAIGGEEGIEGKEISYCDGLVLERCVDDKGQVGQLQELATARR